MEATVGAQPTIKDVAKRAGVSLGTASNVLNGRANVSEARRESVLQAARDVGYRPNRLARSLRQRKSHVIGICVPMISSAYYASVIEELNQVALGTDQQVIQVMTGGDPVRELATVEALLSMRVDGLILIPSAEPNAALELIAQARTPAVIVDRVVSEDRFDLVLIDHASAMQEVLHHLVTLGHEGLLFIVRHPSLPTTRQRIEVLERVMAEAPSRLRGQVLATTAEPEDLPRELRSRLRGPGAPTALITSNSINTLWTLRTLKHLGLRIPVNLSLVAFDEPGWGELVQPPLTLVKQPTQKIAETAWALLMNRIAAPHAPFRRITLQNDFIVRDSTRQR